MHVRRSLRAAYHSATWAGSRYPRSDESPRGATPGGVPPARGGRDRGRKRGARLARNGDASASDTGRGHVRPLRGARRAVVAAGGAARPFAPAHGGARGGALGGALRAPLRTRGPAAGGAAGAGPDLARRLVGAAGGEGAKRIRRRHGAAHGPRRRAGRLWRGAGGGG